MPVLDDCRLRLVFVTPYGTRNRKILQLSNPVPNRTLEDVDQFTALNRGVDCIERNPVRRLKVVDKSKRLRHATQIDVHCIPGS